MHRSDPTRKSFETMRKRLTKMMQAAAHNTNADINKPSFSLPEVLKEHIEAKEKGEIARLLLPNYVDSRLRAGVSVLKGGVRGVFASEGTIPEGTLIAAVKALSVSSSLLKGEEQLKPRYAVSMYL